VFPCSVSSESARNPRGQALDGGPEGSRHRHGTDQRVVGRVEGRVEALRGHDDALVAEQTMDARLPGKPLGVQRSPEIEKHSSLVVRDQRRVSVVEIVGGGLPRDSRLPFARQQVIEKPSQSTSKPPRADSGVRGPREGRQE